VIRQDLNAGADAEDHEEKVEEMLQIHPRRQTRRTCRGRCLDGPRVLPDEPLHGGLTAQTLGNRDRDDEQQEADRKQPEQVEPLLAPDANPGGAIPLTCGTEPAQVAGSMTSSPGGNWYL